MHTTPTLPLSGVQCCVLQICSESRLVAAWKCVQTRGYQHSGSRKRTPPDRGKALSTGYDSYHLSGQPLWDSSEHNLTSARSPQHATSHVGASHVCKGEHYTWIGFSSGCGGVPAVRANYLLTPPVFFHHIPIAGVRMILVGHHSQRAQARVAAD
jgi:hypothetical protein